MRSGFPPLNVAKLLRAAGLPAATPNLDRSSDPDLVRREAMLKFEAADRRRLVLAAAITALSVPLLLRSSSAVDQPAVATVQGEDVAAGLRSGAVATSLTPTASTDIAFLTGPSTTLEPAPILIGVPAARTATEMDGRVGFQSVPLSWKGLPRPCIANTVGPGLAIPVGTSVTLVNISNNHTTTCIVAVHRPIPAGQVMQLSEPIYNELGDQLDAPLPVHISWK